MLDGAEFLEGLFPDFVEVYDLEKDFGDGSDCASSTDPLDLCSAGLPRQGLSPQRVRSDLHMIRVTDERVPDEGKKFFVFTLSIHGIERAGAEGGIRAAEDLATWAYCEAVAGQGVAAPANGAVVNCDAELPSAHPILETQPGSRTAGEVLKKAAVYFVFANPDGWRRGDHENLLRYYQRYNGNGVDLNRDWPSFGYVYRPYTPLSEPESRSIAKVLKSIRPKWDGGLDLHGQLVDRAFSFTMLSQDEADFGKNQRILQIARGAWEDAEDRLGWSPMIIPNGSSQNCMSVGITLCDKMYGVQWGTVWDTIAYTTTGANSDWMSSELGLDADALGNEMSFSHLINCGTGACYVPEIEQLHIDGNKSLIFGMLEFTLEPEDQAFRVPGTVAYIHDPKKVSNPGTLRSPPPTAGLDPQDPILNVVLDASNNFMHRFTVEGPSQGVYNGSVEGKATPSGEVSGVSASSITAIVLERFAGEGEDLDEGPGCTSDKDGWLEVNRYFNQGAGYFQSGQAVHANDPTPGFYRICVTGGLIAQATAVSWDLDISFGREQVWDDPGQKAYSVSNMKFFSDLSRFMAPDQLTRVSVEDVLSDKVKLGRFTSVVIADDPFPGYVEPLPTGPAQPPLSFEPPDKTVSTVPCPYDPELGGYLRDECFASYGFEVEPDSNNQLFEVLLEYPVPGNWHLDVQVQRADGGWRMVGYSNTYSGTDRVEVPQPDDGKYRVRIINNGGGLQPTKLAITFSSVYSGPPRSVSQRSAADLVRWVSHLKDYVAQGGNLVLTDGALKNVGYMGLVPSRSVDRSQVYAGFVSFSADGQSPTFDDPLAKEIDEPGAAEGPGFRHQTYEPVPIGFQIPEHRDPLSGFAPVWSVDQPEWERAGGRTVGTSGPGEVSLGELPVGKGVIRTIGALLPMPSEDYYHPFGLANYSVTYSGYQLLNNVLQWPPGAPSGGPPPLASTGPVEGLGGPDAAIAGALLLWLAIWLSVSLRKKPA